MDTVHPIGTLQTLPFRREGNICHGPGLMDMKGGNYVYLDALRKILEAGIETPLPVTVLFTPDEEIGTPSTRALIEAEAKRHKYILIPEPACPDGSAVIGRYAIARFNLQARGTPSHASWALSEGRSAIAEMARKVAEIEGVHDRGLLVFRGRHPWRAMGQLRVVGLRCRGAEHGQDPRPSG